MSKVPTPPLPIHSYRCWRVSLCVDAMLSFAAKGSRRRPIVSEHRLAGEAPRVKICSWTLERVAFWSASSYLESVTHWNIDQYRLRLGSVTIDVKSHFFSFVCCSMWIISDFKLKRKVSVSSPLLLLHSSESWEWSTCGLRKCLWDKKKVTTLSEEKRLKEKLTKQKNSHQMKMMQSVCSSPELMDPRFSQLRLPASSSSKWILLILLECLVQCALKLFLRLSSRAVITFSIH